ncbi:MAG TPA: hypothetical protein VKY92_07320 [Verrucomicrobiae bacterium]|nr:hypothetical protein [Verrucomicrobiae bacterium]
MEPAKKRSPVLGNRPLTRKPLQPQHLRNPGSGKIFAWTTTLLIAVACFWAPLLSGSEGYLARLGPPPLRFEVSTQPKGQFSWPVPLSRTNSTAGNAVAMPPPAGTDTNSESINSSSSAYSTNNAPSDTAGIAQPGVIPPPGVDTNTFSASNLLNVTPQMLADYFKSTVDNASRYSTNSVNGAEIQFNPPLPPVKPSSEAIYRVR